MGLITSKKNIMTSIPTIKVYKDDAEMVINESDFPAKAKDGWAKTAKPVSKAPAKKKAPVNK